MPAMETVIHGIAILVLGLIGIFIAIMTILMPLYVWQIYKQGVATKRYLDGFNDGFNKLLATLYHIQQNTTPNADE